MTQNDLSVLSGTHIVVGTSTIVKVVPTNFQYSSYIKILSGGGTLEIVAGVTSTGPGWGTGYPIGASEILPIRGPAVFYLAATGATMTATMMVGYTSGATVI